MNCDCGLPATTFTQNGVQFAKCGAVGKNCGFSRCLGNRMPRSIVPQSGNGASSGYNTGPQAYQSMQGIQLNQNQNQNQPQPQRPILHVAIGFRRFEGLMPWFSCSFMYDEELSVYFRTLSPDRCRFISSSRVWEISLLVYKSVVSHLKSPVFGSRLKLDLPPEFLMREEGIWKWYRDIQQRNHDLVASGGVVLKLNSTLEDKLIGYQTEGIKFVVLRGGRAFIADDMGLGKTIQAIGVLLHYRQHWPALVLMPPGLKGNWKKEILENIGDVIKEREITVVTDGKSVVTRPGSKVTLLPYSLLPNLVKNNKINSSTFGIVIADESQKLKNRDADITKSALPLLKQAKVALCLSGTPSPNQPVELFTQLSALLPSLFRSYDDFVTRYCDGGRMSYIGKGRQVQKLGATHTEELNALMMGLVMIRRQKNVVLKDSLPEKKREFVMLKLSDEKMARLGEVKKEKDAAVRKMHSAPADQRELIGKEVQLLTNRYVMETAVQKVPAFLEHLQNVIQDQMDARQQAEAEADKKEALKELARDGDVLASTDMDVQEMADTFLTKSEGRPSVAPPTAFAATTAGSDGSSLQGAKVGNQMPVVTDLSCSQEQSQEDVLRDYEGLEGNQEDWRDISCVASQEAAGGGNGSDQGRGGSVVKEGTAPKLLHIEDDGVVFLGTSPPADRTKKSLGIESTKAVGRTSKMSHAKCTDHCVQPCLKHAGTDTDTDSDSPLFGHGKGTLSSDSEGHSEGATKKRRKLVDSSSESESERLFSRSESKNGSAAKSHGKCAKGKSKSTGTTSQKSRSLKSKSSTASGSRKVTSLLDSDSDNDEAWDRVKQKNMKASERRSNKSRQARLTGQGALAGDGDDDDFSDGEPTKGKKRKKPAGKTSKAGDASGAKPKKTEIPAYLLASQLHHRKLGRKILVFGHHQEVLDQVEAFLNLQEIHFVRIDGSTAGSTRDRLVERFQEDDKTLVALLSITAAGTGFTFHRADIALFPEVQWSFGNMEQAEDRICRIGQTAKVVRCIYYFVPGSGDDTVHQTLQKKANMVGDTVGHSRSVAGAPSSSSDVHSPHRRAQMQLTSYMAPLPPAQPIAAATQVYTSNTTGAGMSTTAPPKAPPRVVDSDSFQYSSGGDSEVVIVGTKKAAPALQAQPSPAVRPRNPSAASVYGGAAGTAFKAFQQSAPIPAPVATPSSSSFAPPNRPGGAATQGHASNQAQNSAGGPVLVRMPGQGHGVATAQAPQASPAQRPLSPTTKARIEANKQRALQRAQQIKAEKAAAAQGAAPQTHHQPGVQNFQNQQHQNPHQPQQQPGQLTSGRGNAIVLTNSGVAKAEEWLKR